MPDDLSPMVAAPDDMPGHFYVKGYTVYEGQLFLTLYLVHPTGEVGMVDEDPIEPLMRLQ